MPQELDATAANTIVGQLLCRRDPNGAAAAAGAILQGLRYGRLIRLLDGVTGPTTIRYHYGCRGGSESASS